MKQKSIALAVIAVIATSASAHRFFDSGDSWKLKTDQDGHVVLNDGKPVYVKPDGSEVAIDMNQTNATISRLNGEAKALREAKERAEAAAKAFEGMDPAKVREAVELAAKIDAKQLIDAGKVDQVKAEITKSYEEKLSTIAKERDEIRSHFHGMMLSNSFSRSEYITKNIAVPVDMIEAAFGRNFKIEADGSVRGYINGNPVYSPNKPGEIATFDEALQVMVNSYPNKDAILKGSGQSGSGARPGAGGGGSREVKRDEFEKMPPAQQAKVAAEAREGKIAIVD